jgi:hypothetical protein
MLPVLEISAVRPLKREGQYPGTDMQPIIRIVEWVPRPDALTASAVNGHEAAAAKEHPSPNGSEGAFPPSAAVNGDDAAMFV